MKYENKTKKRLIKELKQCIAESEAAETKHQRIEEALKKKTEDVLRDSEERFRIFMESASDLMHILNKDGNFTYVNKEMANTLGYTKEEMIGMHITQILHKEHSVKFASRKEELIEKGKLTFEAIWVTKDGIEIHGEIKIVPTYDSDGRQAGSRGVFRDITERKKMEQELEVRARNLEETNIAIRVLLKRRDEDKKELEEQILFNMKELALPYLEKLKESGLNEIQKNYASFLESSLKEITSPFSHTMSLKYSNLTPREFQIVNFIMKDKNSKEIAKLLNVSLKTIEAYRDSIRKKLGIKNKKVNLKIHLSTIQ